ncbi:MAG: hypothetical protein K6E42_05100, partial [Synergistes sp.]|nr:hypothetical protein [Synergistes sp.]
MKKQRALHRLFFPETVQENLRRRALKPRTAMDPAMCSRAKIRRINDDPAARKGGFFHCGACRTGELFNG